MKKKRKNSKQFNQKFKKRFFTKKAAIVLLFAFVIIIGLGIGCVRQRKKAQIYEKTIQELSTEIEELEKSNEDLEDEKNNIDTDEFKEKMAREKLGMIGEDEYSLQQSEDGTQSSKEQTSDKDAKEDSSKENSSEENQKKSGDSSENNSKDN